MRSSPKLDWLQRRRLSVEVVPLPHVPVFHPPAPQPTSGTANSGPTFIWYFAVTEPPPVADDEAAEDASMV